MQFKSAKQRKKVMAKLKPKHLEIDNLPEPVAEKMSRRKPISTLRPKVEMKKGHPRNETPILALKTVKFVVPIVSEMIGLKEPALIAKSVLNSFEDSIGVYEKTENIDDAVVSGIKSFVTNYTVDKVENYVQNIVSISNNETDSGYEVALKGSIIMTSLYAVMENIEGILDEDKS